jgi:hypothetical protein
MRQYAAVSEIRPSESPAAPPTRRRRRRSTALALGIAAWAAAGPALATSISFDTTTLAGTEARLDFTLLDGDGTLGNNTVTIAALATDGTFGGVDCSVSCSGGPPFAITDAGGLGQFLQDLTLGNTFSFDLTFTTDFSGSGAPDRLALLLLDPATNFTLVDTSLDFPNDPVPVQDALLILDLIPGTRIQLAADSNPRVPGRIPEPGTVSLLWLGGVLLTSQYLRNRRLAG